jgi:hypothetical protein
VKKLLAGQRIDGNCRGVKPPASETEASLKFLVKVETRVHSRRLDAPFRSDPA